MYGSAFGILFFAVFGLNVDQNVAESIICFFYTACGQHLPESLFFWFCMTYGSHNGTSCIFCFYMLLHLSDSDLCCLYISCNLHFAQFWFFLFLKCMWFSQRSASAIMLYMWLASCKVLAKIVYFVQRAQIIEPYFVSVFIVCSLHLAESNFS